MVVLLALGMIAVSCGRSDKSSNSNNASGTPTTAASGASDKCKSEPLKDTDVGVTATDITVTVMADVGSPLAPGLFQGNLDALNAFAKYWNANGGIGCRKLNVKTWDSKLSAEESKNGLIDSCKNSFAMVGNNALFNPDVSTLENCPDKAGAATGEPDVAALANDIHEMCGKTLYTVQGISYTCPQVTGVQQLTEFTGAANYYVNTLMKGTKLHGLFMVPGDLPTTVQSATGLVAAQTAAGIAFDDVLKVSGRDAQADYTPRVQAVKSHQSNFVYDGSNDRAMINMVKEAKAQGVTGVKLWACSLACYTKAFAASGGADVEGVYAWMQFLPFEEASANKEASNYVNSVGADKVDSFGAQAWQAAALFKQAVDDVVSAQGPNALTRANVLKALANVKDFTDGGWIGKKDPKGFSPCFVIIQLKGGKWTRVYPEKTGTFDCADSNITKVTLDPVAEAAKIK